MTQLLIDDYLRGPTLLRAAVQGMSREQLLAKPVLGTWSTLQVIAHIADFEPVYADRMKRVIAEDQPLLMAGDPDLFAARLAYEERDLEEELNLISAVRRHVARILLAQSPEVFARTGQHNRDGSLSLEVLLRRVTGHIPHHLKFIADKRRALGLS
ncbi:DinB family protein [Planctomicrobium piriforme]|uniref:DinB superfamily protein n=1 Tax=Planctomicrobium piriforme TaxID=1576369 RepID=A0A1I3ARR5_9PLAN|nr:DinB family protein [Planctomicrobium piriforme]SFH52777.1 DinB superfamily protein [Planctomicrobium piriforme]